MKHLLSILLICSIGFTQELTVDGNLNVTGNIQNQTIDSLLQVIQDLQSQLSDLQSNSMWKTKVFEISYNLTINGDMTLNYLVESHWHFFRSSVVLIIRAKIRSFGRIFP